MEQKLIDEFNEQINMELYSAYMYLEFSINLMDEGYVGYSSWLQEQYKEELEHAQAFIHYMQRRDVKPSLKKIDMSGVTEVEPVKVAEMVLDHEKKISRSIDDLYTMAQDQKDYASKSFLQGFVDEQVEEEEQSTDVLGAFKMAGDDISARIMVDRWLGKRGE